MTPITLNLEMIIDYGPVISLLGKDRETGKTVAVHVDLRGLPYPKDKVGGPKSNPPARLVAHGLAVGIDFGFTADFTDQPGAVPLVDRTHRPDA